MANNGLRDANTGTLGLGERYTIAKGGAFQENTGNRILGKGQANAYLDPNQIARSNSDDDFRKRGLSSKNKGKVPNNFSIKLDDDRDHSRVKTYQKKELPNKMIEDTSVSRRTDWKKIIGPIKKRSAVAGDFNALQKLPSGNKLMQEGKSAAGQEEEAKYDIPNPNNLPILEIKILVAGIDKSGQN